MYTLRIYSYVEGSVVHAVQVESHSRMMMMNGIYIGLYTSV